MSAEPMAPMAVILAPPPSDQPITSAFIVRAMSDEDLILPEQEAGVAQFLTRNGLVIDGVPACRRVLLDAQTFAERTILAELVARLFNYFVLGSIVLPDTPAVMDWLKSFINGSPDQGPLGRGPMLWPVMCPSADRILRKWGFEATPGPIPYVIQRRPEIDEQQPKAGPGGS